MRSRLLKAGQPIRCVPFRIEHGNVPAVVAVEHGGERGSGVHAAIGVGEGQPSSVWVRLGTLADIDV